MKNYSVTINYKNPGWDKTRGLTTLAFGKDEQEALQKVREALVRVAPNAEITWHHVVKRS